MEKINKTTLFLLLTFAISISLAGIYKILGGQPGTIGFTVLAIVYMFIPMISVVIVEKLVHRESIEKKLFISFKLNRWFIAAWLIPPVISGGAFGISLLFPDVTYSPGMEGMIERFENVLTPEKIEEMRKFLDKLPFHVIWFSVLQGLIAGITINAVVAFGEELGWRGFLLKEFKNMHFLKAALIIGFIWGIWHSPIILMGHNYPQHPQLGVLMMTVWCILLSPLFLYITIKSKSVIAAAIMHGTLNGTPGIAIMLIEGGNDLTVGITGLAGFISLFIVLVMIFIYDQLISKENVIGSRIDKFI